MAVNISVLDSTTGFAGLCLQFTRLVFGVGPLYATAYKAWLGAKHKHPGDTDPPYGVPVFWAPHDPGGAGHVAPSLGGGLVRTTNSATRTIYTVAISKITSAWGMSYLGWAEDLNNTRVWTPSAPAQEDDMPLNAADATLINSVVINVMRSAEVKAIIRAIVLAALPAASGAAINYAALAKAVNDDAARRLAS